MRLISRDFTIFERALIIALSLVLVGLAYYWIVDQPVKRGIAEANAERDALQTDLLILENKLLQLRRMQEELDRLGSLELVSRMESYNGSKQELRMLNDILSAADTYSVTFGGVTRSGDQVRRSFSLSYTCSTYEDARQILYELANGDYRCLVGNMSYSGRWSDGSRYNYGEIIPGGDLHYYVSVNANATFFETMYDGVADAGLPGA